MIRELSAFLQSQRRAALRDLAYRFDIDAEALRGMLELLERKGRVRRLAPGTNCRGCCQCDPTQIELYEWQD